MRFKSKAHRFMSNRREKTQTLAEFKATEVDQIYKIQQRSYLRKFKLFV